MKYNLLTLVVFISFNLPQHLGAATSDGEKCLLKESDIEKILCLQKSNTGGGSGPDFGGTTVFNTPPEFERLRDLFGPYYAQ